MSLFNFFFYFNATLMGIILSSFCFQACIIFMYSNLLKLLSLSKAKLVFLLLKNNF